MNPALRFFGVFALFCLANVSDVAAQIVTSTPSIPDAKYISPGGVDMRTGEYVVESPDLDIGPASGGGLTFVRVPQKFKTFTSNWHFNVWKKPNPNGGSYYQIENRAIARTFWSVDNVTFQEASLTLDGLSSLQLLGSGSSRYFVFTAPDGTTTRFQPSPDGAHTWAEEIRQPNGIVYTFAYDTGGASGTTRLRRVSSNTGYQLIVEYFAAPNNGTISGVCGINAAVTTPPAAHTCPGGAARVAYTYSGVRVASVTNAAGAVTTITNNYVNSTTPFQESFYKPGLSQPWLINYYTLESSWGVNLVLGQQALAGGRDIAYTFTYLGRGDLPNGAVQLGLDWTENGLSRTLIHWKTYQARSEFTPAVAGPDRITDPLNRVSEKIYDGSFTKILSVKQPSGLKENYTYNVNRSITQAQQTASTGYGDPALTVSYTYDCTYAVNCKKPATSTDARGNTTNYTYDPAHGGLLTETGPAPTPGATRPQ